jgi:P27 family predicted phage terminase small subunit
LKRLQGTWRADRARPREPKVAPALPRPGRALGPDTVREYNALLKLLGPMRVLSAGDRPALELAAQALATFWALTALLDAHGATYTTTTSSGSTMIRVRPEVQLASDAWRRASAQLARFGLDPTSRARVEEILPGAPPSKWGQILGGDDALTEFMRRRPPSPPGKDPA